MENLEIITTSDGSHSLRNKQLNETYHSVHGAVQESMHVFIQNGLDYYCRNHHPKIISVLEVGFGTGLNALLTLDYAVVNKVAVRYHTLEPFPLEEDVWSKLNYGAHKKEEEYFRSLHAVEWDREISLAPEYTLVKSKTLLQDADLKGFYDVVYFDAFAPSRQPELWSYASLEKVTRILGPEGVFVTYSARGQLKRDLKVLGLKVETLVGPPGKNEMVRGTRLT
ncbi:MAG TPA: tRNA (5-methylaminomethyl-2-thiouridine)(34)-methyltransferase MnmD [Chryseosolibacter sp.]|jgi:Uncharacterized conserved protein